MAVINSVNFLRYRRAKVSQYQHFDALVMRFSVGFFLLCVAVVIGMFSYWRYLSAQLVQVKDNQKTQLNIVTKSASNEALYLLYTARLSALGDILGQRSSQGRGLDFLSTLARPGVSFEAISYEDTEKQLQFRIRAEDVYSVERMLDALKEPVIASQVATIALTDIRRGDDARYTLDAIVMLKDK